MNEKLMVALHLTDAEYNLLLQVHADHNRSMGLAYRTNYSLSEIVKVERNIKEFCLNVYYRNGEWFKYFRDGTWG